MESDGTVTIGNRMYVTLDRSMFIRYRRSKNICSVSRLLLASVSYFLWFLPLCLVFDRRIFLLANDENNTT